MNKFKVLTATIVIANLSFILLLIHAIIKIIFLTQTNPEYFIDMGYGYPGAVVCYMLYNNVVFEKVDVLNEIIKYIMYASGVFSGVLYYFFFKRVENKNIESVSARSFYDIKTGTVKTEDKFEYKKEGLLLLSLILIFYISLICIVGIPWWIRKNKVEQRSQYAFRTWVIRGLFIAFVFVFIFIFGSFSCFDMTAYGRF